MQRPVVGYSTVVTYFPFSPLGIDPQEDGGSSWSAKQPERPQWKRRI